MRNRPLHRATATFLSLALLLSLLGALPASAAGESAGFSAAELTAQADKEALSGASFADGLITTFGELTKRTSSDGAVKSVEVGKNGSSGFEITVTDSADLAVEFSSTGGSNSSTVGLWDASGALVPNNEGIGVVTGTDPTQVTYTGLSAGAYRVVSPDASEHNRGARVYTVTLSNLTGGPRAPRKDWAQVAAPAVTGVSVSGGQIEVSYAMEVGYDGADSVSVHMIDVNKGNLVAGTQEGQDGKAVFTPLASGRYTFTVQAARTGESDLTAHYDKEVDFALPLAAPILSGVTSTGGGKVSVDWNPVQEATGYNVYVNGAATPANPSPISGSSYEVTGLAVGGEYAFTVSAVRDGEVGAASAPMTATATAQAQQKWSFVRFGPSTTDEANGFEGSAGAGSVTIYSEAGRGKIQPTSNDGVAFYYTAVPAAQNFTLRGKIHVDSWTYSNGQDGFGMLARDSVPENGAKADWSNQYMLMASKVDYRYDAETGAVYDSKSSEGVKYAMRLGLGVNAKLGMTPENIALVEASDVDAIAQVASGATYPLETTAVDMGLSAGEYNIVGNCTNLPESTIAQLTDFDVEIQKNNTGYFLTYYGADGAVVGRQKNYEPEALSALDTENVYVGFFASRNARITVSDIQLTLTDPAEDAPAEARPAAQVTPSVSILASAVSANADGSLSLRANKSDYTLSVQANAAGTVQVLVNGAAAAEAQPVSAKVTARLAVPVAPGRNDVEVVFTPYPDDQQSFGENTVLTSLDPVRARADITYETKFAARKTLYVSPLGWSGGTGSPQNPLDIYTAVNVAQPGQTIVVKEGTYLLSSSILIQRGMDGTEDAPISMVADPDAIARPVFDFQGKCKGIIHGGNYWYFRGFDVTRSADGQAGFQVSGSHNTVDQVNAYHNGNTGIYLFRMSGNETEMAQWPSDNLILNCTSYGNADAGYEDADGFAAKLTVGEGNVFDGCVSHHNADDGWDLYARVSGGPIGAVTIQNCIAYSNGYLEDGTNAGNGNGFKMGGENLPGGHKLINSFSFNNKLKGIDSNSCPDIKVYRCTSYNNESYNVALYTNTAPNTDFEAQGVLSFKDAGVKSGLDKADNLLPKGDQDVSKYVGSSNYNWNGSASANNAGGVLTADAFVSLEFTGVTRNADGTPSLGDFLKRSDKAPAGSGADGTGTPSLAGPDVAPMVEGGGSHAGSEATVTYPDGEKVVSSHLYGATEIAVTDAAGALVAQVSLPQELPALDAPFADVPSGHWAAQAVEAMAALGLVKGVDESARTYDLTSPVTRAALAQILYRLANGAPGQASPFADVLPGAWYADAVAWCAGSGAVTGYGSGAFGPDDTLTREQLSVMLCRCANLLGQSAVGDVSALSAFGDGASTSPWAQSSMAWCVENGILQGKNGGVLDPQGSASRAETAVMLYRFIGQL